MKIALRGFDAFKTRAKYGIGADTPLPPLCRAFYSTFEVGLGKMSVPGAFLPQVGQVAGIVEQRLELDGDFVLQDFLSPEEARVFFDQTYEKSEAPQHHWPIAECNANKCIVVGIDQTNLDEIFLENLTLFADGTRYRRLAANVFEFVSRILYVENDAPGHGIPSYDTLYRRWGESFWRFEK